MKKISVKVSTEYDVIIERGIIDNIGPLSKGLVKAGKACVVSDTNVAPLYMERVKASLEKCGFSVFEYVFSAGEASKNMTTFAGILNFLAKNRFTRDDTLFALGGGVVGDITGFSASAYMRGINFIGIPTSLLSAVDSSVGGKTGIDLDCGKNLAGAFYQPKAVFFDIDTLKTLPSEYFSDGMAEVIKYAMIRGFDIEKLILEDAQKNLEEIISRCIQIKTDVVTEDEFEGGIRRILNFGHTIGHAIETLSEYKISHGRAVAMGMYIITNAFEKRGLCKKGTLDSLKKMLDIFSLETECNFGAEKLLKIAKNDKKAQNDGINIVVPKAVGECDVIKVSEEELFDIFKEGLEQK